MVTQTPMVTNKPRRILIFSLVYYPRFVGGAEIAIKEITDRISESEIEFDMVTLRLDSNLPRFERIGNINIHRIGWTGKMNDSKNNSLSWYLNINKYAYLILGLFKALSLHHKRKYDATWSLMASYNSFAALFFKMIHPNIPFIFTLQDGDPITYLRRRALPLYPLFKMIFSRADHIQAISKHLADWALDMGAKCPITVIPNAVDIRLFSSIIPEQDSRILKEKLRKKEGDIFIITTSRLVLKNAVSDIISALTYLSSNVKLIILGSGQKEEELKSQSLELKLIGQTDTEDRVKFLGQISHADIPYYLQVSDIFIRPSLSEGLGNSFLEAMTAGIPVIATPVGGIPDFLIDGETGIFCEINNPHSIAQKVEKLIKDKESRDYIVHNAKNMVQERYGWDTIVSRMNMVFQSLTSRGDTL